MGDIVSTEHRLDLYRVGQSDNYPECADEYTNAPNERLPKWIYALESHPVNCSHLGERTWCVYVFPESRTYWTGCLNTKQGLEKMKERGVEIVCGNPDGFFAELEKKDCSTGSSNPPNYEHMVAHWKSPWSKATEARVAPPLQEPNVVRRLKDPVIDPLKITVMQYMQMRRKAFFDLPTTAVYVYACKETAFTVMEDEWVDVYYGTTPTEMLDGWFQLRSRIRDMESSIDPQTPEYRSRKFLGLEDLPLKKVEWLSIVDFKARVNTL